VKREKEREKGQSSVPSVLVFSCCWLAIRLGLWSFVLGYR
jgi:hypothetical protein